ncbi:RNA/RNP complex-1-interacting phosphatase [Parambassis ranga]|uniref:RNA/RNP complex-1-interacting phosphatase n=1 Tax=Parambassis ranga TaxID=210632 RepID=A0A6P7JD81_9TELE|nr:RNA/RNP complex-1-interacting phosphatase [Parambassis ranga]
MSKKKNGIPDRWLDYSAVGKRLSGTRFIAFKVPLKQSLSRQLHCSDVFGPWELLDALNKEKQELGLIIDLTFTTRYYKVQDIPDSLLCVKIFTAGHQVPSDDTILSFKRAVSRFLRENQGNDKLIGVHCTHGLNRTGYLICRYLIDVDGMEPSEAVELFNASRGHMIERQNYLDDLHRGPKRSNEGMEEFDQEPQRGQAAHRPSYSSSDSDCREDRRTRRADSWQHRPPRGSAPRSHHRPPQDGLLPCPPLLPSPPPPYPPHSYRWTRPHPDNQWRRHRHPQDTWSRFPSSEPEWRPSHRLQQDRRRAAPPPLPRYTPRWTAGYDRPEQVEEDWAGDRVRQDRYRQRSDY